MMCLKNKNFEQSQKSILGTVKTNSKWVWYPTSDKNYAVEPVYKIWVSKKKCHFWPQILKGSTLKNGPSQKPKIPFLSGLVWGPDYESQPCSLKTLAVTAIIDTSEAS